MCQQIILLCAINNIMGKEQAINNNITMCQQIQGGVSRAENYKENEKTGGSGSGSGSGRPSRAWKTKKTIGVG